ncbi:MAG: hypothetical protein V4538_01645 [Bacteroidota bacterium]
MKYNIRKQIQYTMFLYTTAYLVYSFCHWSLINPFTMLIQLPTDSIDIRSAKLFGWIGIQFIIYCVTQPFGDEEQKENKSNTPTS